MLWYSFEVVASLYRWKDKISDLNRDEAIALAFDLNEYRVQCKAFWRDSLTEDSPKGLSLEEEFAVRTYWSRIRNMTELEAKEELISLYASHLKDCIAFRKDTNTLPSFD